MAQSGAAATTSVDRSSPTAGAPHAADDRAAALAAARQAAAMLIERYGARRVYLFGSLAGTGSALFHPASDIDLAVEGLSEGVWWRSYPAVDKVMPPGHPANTVRLESVPLFIKEMVLERGALLASADDGPSADWPAAAARLLDDEVTIERPRWRLLAEEIEHELDRMGEFVTEAGPLTDPAFTTSSSLELRAGGSILHDFYNGAERSFQRIARIVDEHVPSDEHWHQTLLAQMAVPYPDRRPKVISEAMRDDLDKYLRFRHRFRNIYGPDLDWSRLVGLLHTLDDTHRALSAEFSAFCTYLRRHPAGRGAGAAEAD